MDVEGYLNWNNVFFSGRFIYRIDPAEYSYVWPISAVLIQFDHLKA